MEDIETDGKIIEVWVVEDHIADSFLVKVFAAKMERPHAHGVWLICDHQWHEKSNNPKWKGFQKIFRMKYKPTKFKYQHKLVMNSRHLSTMKYISDILVRLFDRETPGKTK